MSGYKSLGDRLTNSGEKKQGKGGMVHVSVVVEEIVNQWGRNWVERNERAA